MALPYPTKVVLPFDIATAQDMNERHANDVALAAGTGLDDGAVTAPKLDWATLGIAFKVIKLSNQSVPASTFAEIDWQEALYDEGGNFDLGENSFTAPIKGIYHLDAQWTADSGQENTRKQAIIRVNGTVLARSEYAAGGYGSQVSLDALLEAGDVITVEAFGASNATTIDSSASFTWFNGHIVRPMF